MMSQFTKIFSHMYRYIFRGVATRVPSTIYNDPYRHSHNVTRSKIKLMHPLTFRFHVSLACVRTQTLITREMQYVPIYLHKSNKLYAK